jgi:hypothetical protein
VFLNSQEPRVTESPISSHVKNRKFWDCSPDIARSEYGQFGDSVTGLWICGCGEAWWWSWSSFGGMVMEPEGLWMKKRAARLLHPTWNSWDSGADKSHYFRERTIWKSISGEDELDSRTPSTSLCFPSLEVWSSCRSRELWTLSSSWFPLPHYFPPRNLGESLPTLIQNSR